MKKLVLDDFVGKKFGRLTILSLCEGKYQTELLCKCDCGSIKQFSNHQLTSGKVKSCGCYSRDVLLRRNFIHGQSVRTKVTREYKAWAEMKHRCYDEKYYLYHRYGGRGIKVCERWLDSFENFYADMGERPSNKHSLDRFPNNDGDYEPNNCRWATQKEQCRNQSKNVLITINGEAKCVSEWAGVYGISEKTIFNRIYSGWDVIESVTKPKRGSLKLIP